MSEPGQELEAHIDPDNVLPDDDWAWAFFRSYLGEDGQGNLGNITRAANAAGRSYDVVYLRRQRDTIFQALFDNAEKAILEAVWSVTLREAIDGTERPIFQRGELVGHVREVDWQTRRWILERLDPERFHLPTRVEMVSGDAPGAFTFQLGEDPIEQIDDGELEQEDHPE